MTAEITIRSAVAKDAPTLMGLIEALAAYEKLSDEVLATPAQLEATLFCARPAAEVLLGEVAGEAVGYALFFPTYSTFLGRPGLWLEDLFVLPAHRGQGHGRALLSRVAARAREIDPAGRLEWSVLDWNTPARGFYESLGARPQEGWTTYRLTGERLHQLAGADPSASDTL